MTTPFVINMVGFFVLGMVLPPLSTLQFWIGLGAAIAISLSAQAM